MTFPLALNEAERVAELHSLGLLDTASSPSFDAITAAAVELFGVPMSLVSLMDEDRQWFKSAVGFGATIETPRAIAFCAYPVASGDYFDVEDAIIDVRFADNPLVVSGPGVRFYAGAPIISPSGNALGTVCILDAEPRDLSAEERRMLEHLAEMAAALCEEHRQRNQSLNSVEQVLTAIGDAVLADGSGDVSRQRRLQQELEYLTDHDRLTGALDRVEFERQLGAAISTARQTDQSHAVLYLDLDQFRIVNDQFGHVIGDELLRQVAALITNELTSADTVAHLGGDEFGIVLQNYSVDQAMFFAERIVGGVQQLRHGFVGLSIHTGVSIGVVAITADSPNVGDVLKHADIACCMAKQGGGNGAQLVASSDRAIIEWTGSIRWLSALNDALEIHRTGISLARTERSSPRNYSGTIDLYAQPIVALDDVGAPCHIEVLTRLNIGGRRYQPHAFMPSVERHKLGPRFDEMIISQTLEALAVHPMATSGLGSVSINLCGQSVGTAGFATRVRELIDASQIEADLVRFEITEAAAVADPDGVAGFMDELAERGCRFALDNFGKGRSSFAFLKRLPIDSVKIDGSFIRDIAADPIHQFVATSIVGVCNLLETSIVAEGIETPESLSAVADLSIGFGQGFHLGHPAPLIDLLGDAARMQSETMQTDKIPRGEFERKMPRGEFVEGVRAVG